jgi:hypothetical protein
LDLKKDVNEKLFLFLVTVFSQSFFPLVRGHFVSFSFFSAWHILYVNVLKFKHLPKQNLRGLVFGTQRYKKNRKNREMD